MVRLLCDVNTLNCYDNSTNPANCSACTSTPIPGTLCRKDTNSGNYMAVLHEDGTYSWYAHIQKGGFYVAQWNRVRRGDPLALSGNVGCSGGAHLHWQVNGCDPVDCGHSTIPSSFQALDAIEGNVVNCYVPLQGDDLFSNNFPWNDPP
jgi:murein DD-endopeptidase MepM/ murein hydrolase activator NlpD